MAKRPRRAAAPAAPAVPTVCPCGRDAAYADCCARLHRGQAAAGSPEELMRSRYSAFVVGDTAYLMRSWHPSTRPPALELDRTLRWSRLEVVGAAGGGPFHTAGTVEFRAHYRQGGRAGVMHEVSRFALLDAGWVYVDGDVSTG